MWKGHAHYVAWPLYFRYIVGGIYTLVLPAVIPYGKYMSAYKVVCIKAEIFQTYKKYQTGGFRCGFGKMKPTRTYIYYFGLWQIYFIPAFKYWV